MARRRTDIHNVGSFFSTDAGGAPNSAYGALGQTDGVPWESNIPGLEDFLGTISSLQVPELGVFTPWAKLVQAPTQLGWGVVPLSAPPDTNILAFEFAQVAQMLNSLGFGQPGFLAYLSEQPLAPLSVQNSLLNTPYELFEDGLAVFSQADTTGIPRMQFLYWIRLRDPGDTSGGPSAVGVAAASLGAKLVFAQQVNAATTTTRSPPTADVTAVAEMQYPALFATIVAAGNGTGNGVPALPPPPTGLQPPNGGDAAPQEASMSMVGPIIAGLAAAAIGVAVGRGAGKKRKKT